MDYKIELAQHTICVLELPTLKVYGNGKPQFGTDSFFFFVVLRVVSIAFKNRNS